VWEFVESSARRAITNAQGAAETLHRQIEDRRRLAPVDAEAAQGLAGELSRMSRQECLRLLRTRHVGRLAYVARDETPDIVPVNYVMDGDDGVLIRTGPGPKLQAAARSAVVAFEVDEIDEHARIGWSVVVTAQASVVARTRPEQASRAGEPWASGPREDVIRLQVRRMEGRRLS
jgi:nitroimidazol reductase NimA-like FMN-containing flavoprotein (pyridoxamine 5'-phosphate oxidase superfamily)